MTDAVVLWLMVASPVVGLANTYAGNGPSSLLPVVAGIETAAGASEMFGCGLVEAGIVNVMLLIVPLVFLTCRNTLEPGTNVSAAATPEYVGATPVPDNYLRCE